MKKKLAIILAVILAFSTVQPAVFMAEIKDTVSNQEIWINPLYEEVQSEEETAQLIKELQETETSAEKQAKSARANVVYSSIEEAISYIRAQMVARSTTITVAVKWSVFPEDVWAPVYAAMEYTEDCTGQEGDALLAALRGIRASRTSGPGSVVVTYTFTYMSTAEQEQKLTKAVGNALSKLNLKGKSDYQKVRLIYDYICDNVDYDYDHLYVDSEYLPMYTAYAALCEGTAVCQGYAALFYRMCKDAGLSVRFISGYAGGPHAWNIVRIGDVYYNLDCTWDGQDEATHHNWFLNSDEDFKDHYRDEEYDTSEFYKQFPMASDSWEDSVLIGGQRLNINNVGKEKMLTLEGDYVTNQAENGRPKLLIFGRCYYEEETQETISNLSNGDFDDIDIVYIECLSESKEELASWRKTYGSSKDGIKYVYNPNGDGDGYWSLFDEYETATGQEVYYKPFLVLIDEKNKIQYCENGVIFTAEEIRKEIDTYTRISDKFHLSKKSISIKKGNTKDLDVYLNGELKNSQFFTWKSSNTKVAKVDANGTVKAVGTGMATITCQAYDGTYTTCKVTVSSNDSNLKGMHKDADGIWRYYKKGAVDTSYTALTECKDGWIYIKKGEMDKTYTGMVKKGSTWMYVKKGKWDKTYTGMVKKGSTWMYVKKGKWDNTYTGMVKKGTTWMYVKKGKWDKTYTGMVKKGSTWMYVKKGKWDKTYTGMVKKGSTWMYVKKGKWDKTYTGMAKKGTTWMYVKKGKWDNTYTGMVKKGTTWMYVKKGKWDKTYTGMVKKNSTWMYVKKGKWDNTFTGIAKKGSTMMYVKKGKWDSTFNGLATNKEGTWYMKKGKVDTSYSGKYTYKGKTYTIKAGKVVK